MFDYVEPRVQGGVVDRCGLKGFLPVFRECVDDVRGVSVDVALFVFYCADATRVTWVEFEEFR